MSNIDVIKNRISIPDLFDYYNLGRFKNPCRTPLRNSDGKSFTAWKTPEGIWIWQDKVTGEAGDVIKFVQAYEGCDFKHSIEALEKIVGITCTASRVPIETRKPVSKRIYTEQFRTLDPDKIAKRRIWQNTLEIPSWDDLVKISELRGFDPHALNIAADKGLLKVTHYWGHDCYVVTDFSRINAKARRMDGNPWQQGKSINMPGSENYPIGLRESTWKRGIAVVEGETDLLACYHFLYINGELDNVAPIAMGGAACNLSEPDRWWFEDKRIRIFPDDDSAGRAAAFRWATVLRSWNCVVDAFSFWGMLTKDGKPVKDLTDLAQISIESYRTYGSAIREMLRFIQPFSDNSHE